MFVCYILVYSNIKLHKIWSCKKDTKLTDCMFVKKLSSIIVYPSQIRMKYFALENHCFLLRWSSHMRYKTKSTVWIKRYIGMGNINNIVCFALWNLAESSLAYHIHCYPIVNYTFIADKTASANSSCCCCNKRSILIN